MATWDITVSAQSAQGVGAAGFDSIDEVVPGDFGGATIDSIAVQGSPSFTTTNTGAPKDDAIGVRFWVENDSLTDIYGGSGSDAASLAFAQATGSSTSETIADGSSPSPAPGTAVAADWDRLAYLVNYTAEMKDDGETCSWSSFTIRVTYTESSGPPAAVYGYHQNMITS